MYQSNWRRQTARMFGARLVNASASLRTAGVLATGEPEVILLSPEELRRGDVVAVDIDIAPHQAVRCVVEIAGDSPLCAGDAGRSYWADIVKFVGTGEDTWRDLFRPATPHMMAMAA